MIFAHANHTVAFRVDHRVGIAQERRHSCLRTAGIRPVLWRDRSRRQTNRLSIQFLIAKVRKVNHAALHGVISAAVFVDPRAGVEFPRRHVDTLAVTRVSDNYLASAFRRSHLDPINVVAVQLDLAQPDGFFDY